MDYFYLSSTILIESLMLAMTIHVGRYSGFDRHQKNWYIVTFASIMFCAAAEYAVHCGYYDPAFKIPLYILTVLQFSIAPIMASAFTGALGLHKLARRSVFFFFPHVLLEIIAAPFGWIFSFTDSGYQRGDFFVIYFAYYLLIQPTISNPEAVP